MQTFQPQVTQIAESNQQLAQMLAMLLEKMHQPKEVIRDENGKIVGVK